MFHWKQELAGLCFFSSQRDTTALPPHRLWYIRILNIRLSIILNHFYIYKIFVMTTNLKKYNIISLNCKHTLLNFTALWLFIFHKFVLLYNFIEKLNYLYSYYKIVPQNYWSSRLFFNVHIRAYFSIMIHIIDIKINL